MSLMLLALTLLINPVPRSVWAGCYKTTGVVGILGPAISGPAVPAVRPKPYFHLIDTPYANTRLGFWLLPEVRMAGEDSVGHSTGARWFPLSDSVAHLEWSNGFTGIAGNLVKKNGGFKFGYRAYSDGMTPVGARGDSIQRRLYEVIVQPIPCSQAPADIREEP